MQGEKGGKVRRGWDFEASFCPGPLTLSMRSYFRPFFLFRAISFSSSSELSSMRATTKPEVHTPKSLSSSPSESETLTRKLSLLVGLLFCGERDKRTT